MRVITEALDRGCAWGQTELMTGTTRSSAELDPRRRRALFRAWHRGMREMDLIMGRFADAEIADLDEEALTDFETLIELPDRDLLSWITGQATVPTEHDTPLWRRLAAFHRHDAPLHG